MKSIRGKSQSKIEIISIYVRMLPIIYYFRTVN